MPQSFKPYTEEQDGRRKLSTPTQDAIRERYALGGVSWQQLADEYGVSKSRIGQIVNPERAAKVAKRQREHWRDYQARGAEWAAVQRKTRDKKRRLGLAFTTKRRAPGA